MLPFLTFSEDIILSSAQSIVKVVSLVTSRCIRKEIKLHHSIAVISYYWRDAPVAITCLDIQ